MRPGRKGVDEPVLEPIWLPQTETFRIDEVRVYDTHRRLIGYKELARRLRKETLAVVYYPGRALDPLHLRLFKEGTLVFDLSAGQALKLELEAPPIPLALSRCCNTGPV
jgi:hypothetical protein